MPSIVVSPNPVAPGKHIDVRGSGFSPNSGYKVNAGTAFTADGYPLADGTFATAVPVPSTPGTGGVIVTVGGKTVAQVSFTIDAPVVPLTFKTTLQEGEVLSDVVPWIATEVTGTIQRASFLIDDVLVWPEASKPWGGNFDTKTIADGDHVFEVIAYASATDMVGVVQKTNVMVKNAVVVPSKKLRVGSGWGHTKDNIQGHKNGNGDVAYQFAKVGKGPITGVSVQDRFGTPSQVYSKGDGGLYEVAVRLAGPDSAPVTSVMWKPGTNGGKADAAFPDIPFSTPTSDVDDGAPFWITFINKHASPDANYTSFNVLLCRGIPEPSPRQPTFDNNELAVLVNTGSGWTDFKRTPMIDVWPNHEGFGYSSNLQEAWHPVGGNNQVRQTFTTDDAFSFSQISAMFRRQMGSGNVTAILESLSGAIMSQVMPTSGIAATSAGVDTPGEQLVRAACPQTSIPAGTYRLRFTAPSGTQYSMSPLRKARKGTYPTLTHDWGSYTCPGGMAEYSSDGGSTWKRAYANGAQDECDLQFGLA